jgi:hypothetical protein
MNNGQKGTPGAAKQTGRANPFLLEVKADDGFTQGEARACQLLCVIARELAAIRVQLARAEDCKKRTRLRFPGERKSQLEFFSRS